MLPLIDAERAWAYAMQLKSEANTELRKRFHMMSRLRKAVQHASTLDRLCNDSGLFDARTKLEVEVGRLFTLQADFIVVIVLEQGICYGNTFPLAWQL